MNKQFLESKGQVETIVNGDVVQKEGYKINYDGNKADFAIYNGKSHKLMLGKLDNNDIKELLINKNDKSSLKDNLEKLLPKNKVKNKKSTKKSKRRTRKKVTKKRRKNKKKTRNKMLKDFLNFFD